MTESNDVIALGYAGPTRRGPTVRPRTSRAAHAAFAASLCQFVVAAVAFSLTGRFGATPLGVATVLAAASAFAAGGAAIHVLDSNRQLKGLVVSLVALVVSLAFMAVFFLLAYFRSHMSRC